MSLVLTLAIICALVIVIVLAITIAYLLGFSIFIALLPKSRKRIMAKNIASRGDASTIKMAKQLQRALEKDKTNMEDLELANQLKDFIEKQSQAEKSPNIAYRANKK